MVVDVVGRETDIPDVERAPSRGVIERSTTTMTTRISGHLLPWHGADRVIQFRTAAQPAGHRHPGLVRSASTLGSPNAGAERWLMRPVTDRTCPGNADVGKAKPSMSFFAELKAANAAEWNDNINHTFVAELGAGTLPLVYFQDYLVQDYHFLVSFARAYALAAVKGRTLQDVQDAYDGLSVIVRETGLHLELTERWGLTRQEVEDTPEKAGTVAYTRYVLDTGISGDLLDLHVALAPCVIGYAEIGRRLSPRLTDDVDHPYREWIQTYASDEFQAGAQAEIDVIDSLAARFLTEDRRRQVSQIFATATRMESAFWQQALHE